MCGGLQGNEKNIWGRKIIETNALWEETVGWHCIFMIFAGGIFFHSLAFTGLRYQTENRQ